MPPRDPFPRCGSGAPNHRFRTCRECNRLYGRVWRARHSQRVMPKCAFCGRARGDSAIPVYGYALSRSIKVKGGWKMRQIASIQLCDPCIQTHARPAPNYTRRHGLMPGSWTARPLERSA